MSVRSKLSARLLAPLAGALVIGSLFLPTAASAASGDPNVTITSPSDGQHLSSGQATTVRGTATDNRRVSRVAVGVQNLDTHRWLRSDGSWGSSQSWLTADADSTYSRSTTWTYEWTPSASGSFSITAQAWDNGNRTDGSEPSVDVEVSTTTNPPPSSTTTTWPSSTTSTTTGSSSCGTQPSSYGAATMTLNLNRSGRSLPTTVMYPTTSSGAIACGRHPLIVVGHGAAGTGSSAASLHRFLVTAGYVIAAPTFPSGFDFPAMAEDVSYVIDQVLAQSAGSSGTLSGHVDASRIGYIGTSMGGMIGFTLYQSCCLDPRIGAVVSKIGNAPSGSYRWADGPPLLMINGTADTTVSYSSALAAYNSAASPKGLISLQGVGHDLNVGSTNILSEAPLGFFAYYLLGQSNGLQRVSSAVASTSIAQLTSSW